MLARLSIRTKITVVVAFLLFAMSVMGALNIRQMYAINAATVDITNSWLPSVRVLGELRAAMSSVGFNDVDLAPGPELAEAQLRRGDLAAATESAREYQYQARQKGQPWAMARASVVFP